MGKLRARGRRRFPKRGPIYVAINWTQNGLTSWTIAAGPWSWNSRKRRHRVDAPGPFYWESDRTDY